MRDTALKQCDQGAYGTRLGSIFNLKRAPAFIHRNLQTSLLAVTEIRDDAPEHRVTDPLPIEGAYLASLHLRPYANNKAWDDSGMWPVRSVFQGATLLRDLKRRPTVLIDQPHHSMHFYIPQTALDLITDQSDARRITELMFSPGEPLDDPVIAGLASSMQGAFALQDQVNRMFLDHIMLAVATHAAQAYGGMQVGSRRARGILATWQEQRAKEMISANLNGDAPLADLARECRLSISQFCRLFKGATGLSPHQWLLHRRIDVAKDRLKDRRTSLAEIALGCGFADQSHFTRVFRQLVGVSPGRWRDQDALSLPSALGSQDRVS
jgi:AraC-like DNA-binding protein